MLRGVDGLNRRLRDLFDRLETEAAPGAVRAGLGVLEAGAQRRTPVDTGALVSSEVETDPAGNRRGWVGGTVTAASGHAAAVEWGTSRQPAQPFLTPALEEDHGDAARAVADELRDQLRGMV